MHFGGVIAGLLKPLLERTPIQVPSLQDRRPHSYLLLDPPHPLLLLRLQLPHMAHVATLEDQGGPRFGGEGGAVPPVLLGRAIQGCCDGEQGRQATKRAIAPFE